MTEQESIQYPKFTGLKCPICGEELDIKARFYFIEDKDHKNEFYAQAHLFCICVKCMKDVNFNDTQAVFA